MRFEQKVVVKIVNDLWESGDVYDDGIDDYVDADGLSSAEEGFMRGYVEEANFEAME